MRPGSRRALLAAGTAAVAAAALTRGRPGSTQPAASPAASPWATEAPIPLARSELAAAVIDGIVYVCGGFGGGKRVDAFDPATGTWTPMPDLPFEVHHPGVAALDGRVVVAGGYTTRGFIAMGHAWAWRPGDPAGWQQLASLPSPRGAFGMAVAGGVLYAAGGAFEQLGGPVCPELLRYDAAADAWEPLTPLPTPREHLAVVADGRRLYAIGGRALGLETDDLASANEVYDPATNAWATARPLPVPRGGLSGVFTGDAVVVLGGERGKDLFADANRYDPAADAWTALPPMPTARHGLASAVVGGRMYAITGSTLAGRIQNTAIVERLALAPSGATPVA